MSKQLNVGQQPNSPKITKDITNTITQRNVGVDKILLNVNGGNSELITNKNAILKYSLKQPIQLDPGDTITCINAFVEEKGLQSNTISLEKDIETEMRFMYYKQGDLGDETSTLEGVGYTATPKHYTDCFIETAKKGYVIPGSGSPPSKTTFDRQLFIRNNFLNIFPTSFSTYAQVTGDVGFNNNFNAVGYGASLPTSAVDEFQTDVTSGCNGNYYYLCENVEYTAAATGAPRSTGGGGDVPVNQFMRPCFGSKIIKIRAGNYSVDSLANIISDQLNGSLGQNQNEFSDALLDKLYHPEISSIKDRPFATTPFFQALDVNSDLTQKDVIGDCGEKDGFERRVEGVVKQINLSDDSYYDSWAWQNMWNAQGSPSDRLNGQGRNPDANSLSFPNDNTVIVAVGGSNTPMPDFEKLMTASAATSTNKSCHFYMNLGLLYRYYETEGKWYNLEGLDTNTANFNNRFYPAPTADFFYQVIDPVVGYLPAFTSNKTIEGNYQPTGPDPNTNPGEGAVLAPQRYNFIERAMLNQCLVPVKGYKYPGVNNLEPTRQKFAGTSVAQVTFSDATSNRFAISNLHEFYKLPNLTGDATAPSGFGGQQATKFNNVYFNDSRTLDQTGNVVSGRADMQSPIYPVDSTSGIAITNFDLNLVKPTKIYQDLVAKIQAIDGDTAPINQILHKEKLIYDLFTKPFDKFFGSTEDAQAAWQNSLWFRLGFTYDQIGDISSNLETVRGIGQEDNPTGGADPRKGAPSFQQKGIITHNNFDFTKIVASDGLGVGNPSTTAQGTPLQNYRLTSYFMGKGLTSNLGLAGNYFTLLSDSKNIEAKNLPSLNAGKSYLLIESDIIKPNFKDNRANWGNLLAVMSKENATNDTIFGAEPIDFTVTESKLLTDLTLYIKNPDGTLASDDVVGKNNGFIIQIQKAIKPSNLPIVD